MSFSTNVIAVNGLADARITSKIADNTIQPFHANLQKLADVDLSSSGNKALVISADGTGFEATSTSLGPAAFLSTGTAAGNIPVLDGNGKLPSTVLPGLALTNVTTVTASTDLAALSATYQSGDIFIVTDESKTFVHNGGTAESLADFTELLTTPTSVDLSLAAGTLTVEHGGTGAATFTANGLLFGSGTDALQTAAAPTTSDTFLKWDGAAFTWASIATTRISSTDGRAFVGTDESGYENKVVIAADAPTDGSKIVATFVASDAADAGERVEFTHASGEVQIKGLTSDGQGDVDIRLMAQNGGQVYLGEPGDGAIQGDDDSTLTFTGGQNTGILRGDLILQGGAGTGANAGGHVFIRGGDSATGTDGVVTIQDSAAKAVATFSGVASAVNHLIFTNAVTSGDVVIGSAGSDASVDIVIDPAGTGLLLAATGYDMSGGSALAFATKGYADGLRTALQTEIDAIETAVGLSTTGTLVAFAGNYTTGAGSVAAAVNALDTQVKTNTDAIAAKASQTEVDAIETAVGLATNGTLPAWSGLTYVTDASSIIEAITDLDAAIANVETDVNATAVLTGTTVALLDANHIAILTNTAARSVSLPAGSTVGKLFVVKDGAGTAATGNITIDPNGSETIDGMATLVLDQNYESITLIWNGTQWNRI